MPEGDSDRRNRRNYYRILHVQPDAPAAILKSSYRALMRHLEMHPDRGGDHWNASLVNEAYEVLSDPERRAAYDETIDFMEVARGRARRPDDVESDRDPGPPSDGDDDSTGSSSRSDPVSPDGDATTDGSGSSASTASGRSTRGAAASRGASGYGSNAASPEFDRTANVHEVEHSECLFCGSGWAMTVANPPSIVCAECKSPLTLAGTQVLEDGGRRAARRIEREGSIRYFEEWPQATGRSGHIVDLSPMGMQFTARRAVEQYHIIKIEGPLLDAIGSVANCRETDEEGGARFAVGVQFYTVRFNQARGTFLSTEA